MRTLSSSSGFVPISLLSSTSHPTSLPMLGSWEQNTPYLDQVCLDSYQAEGVSQNMSSHLLLFSGVNLWSSPHHPQSSARSYRTSYYHNTEKVKGWATSLHHKMQRICALKQLLGSWGCLHKGLINPSEAAPAPRCLQTEQEREEFFFLFWLWEMEYREGKGSSWSYNPKSLRHS